MVCIMQASLWGDTEMQYAPLNRNLLLTSWTNRKQVTICIVECWNKWYMTMLDLMEHAILPDPSKTKDLQALWMIKET